MRTPSLALIACLSLGACPRSPAQPTDSADPPPRPRAQGSERAQGGERPAPRLSAEWLQEQIARGRLAERAAPQGVVWVEHFQVIDDTRPDPRADAAGLVHEARRRCGADLVAGMATLQRMLEAKIAALGDDAMRCAGSRCVFPPIMEYDFEVTLEFSQDSDGPRLVSVLRRDPPADDASEENARIAASRAAAARSSCPQSDAPR